MNVGRVVGRFRPLWIPSSSNGIGCSPINSVGNRFWATLSTSLALGSDCSQPSRPTVDTLFCFCLLLFFSRKKERERWFWWRDGGEVEPVPGGGRRSAEHAPADAHRPLPRPLARAAARVLLLAAHPVPHHRTAAVPAASFFFI